MDLEFVGEAQYMAVIFAVQLVNFLNVVADSLKPEFIGK